MKKPRGRVNLLDVLMGCLILDLVLFFTVRQAFFYALAFTGVLGCMYLVMVWDDIVVWWSTKR